MARLRAPTSKAAQRRSIFMVFLPARSRNLHDPACSGPPAATAGRSAEPASALPAKIAPKRLFHLTISYLSHANYAVLRRNIIAFHLAEQDYFLGCSNSPATRRDQRERAYDVCQSCP